MPMIDVVAVQTWTRVMEEGKELGYKLRAGDEPLSFYLVRPDGELALRATATDRMTYAKETVAAVIGVAKRLGMWEE